MRLVVELPIQGEGYFIHRDEVGEPAGSLVPHPGSIPQPLRDVAGRQLSRLLSRLLGVVPQEVSCTEVKCK